MSRRGTRIGYSQAAVQIIPSTSAIKSRSSISKKLLLLPPLHIIVTIITILLLPLLLLSVLSSQSISPSPLSTFFPAAGSALPDLPRLAAGRLLAAALEGLRGGLLGGVRPLCGLPGLCDLGLLGRPPCGYRRVSLIWHPNDSVLYTSFSQNNGSRLYGARRVSQGRG
jgi:hypothetical protein